MRFVRDRSRGWVPSSAVPLSSSLRVDSFPIWRATTIDDILLRQNALDELDFRPDVDASHVGVSAENGVVTLSGHVGTYAEKVAAEEATKALTGVLAVADEVEVRFAGDTSSRDDQVAQRA